MGGWQEAVDRALPAGATVSSSAQLPLPPEPRSVPLARRFVVEHAPTVRPAEPDSLLLLTSELVTNAVVHARTELQLAVTVTEDDVVVTVHDLDLGRRELRTHEREGGRGLVLVEALAAAWGQVVHRAGGKTAWFRLPRGD